MAIANCIPIFKIPEEYFCPVSDEVLLDPMRSKACGCVFDRIVIIRKNLICPKHQKQITGSNQDQSFIPDAESRKQVQKYIENNPELFENKNYAVLRKERLLKHAEQHRLGDIPKKETKKRKSEPHKPLYLYIKLEPHKPESLWVRMASVLSRDKF